MSCLLRKNSSNASFAGGQFFCTAFIAKTAKTFLLYSLFFAVEVLIVSCLHRQNSAQCKFRRWASFSHGVYCKNCKNFCLLPARLFCNCLPSSWCLFGTVFFYKNSCILFCNFVLVPFVDLKVCVCCFLRCVLQSSSALNFKT